MATNESTVQYDIAKQLLANNIENMVGNEIAKYNILTVINQDKVSKIVPTITKNMTFYTIASFNDALFTNLPQWINAVVEAHNEINGDVVAKIQPNHYELQQKKVQGIRSGLFEDETSFNKVKNMSSLYKAIENFDKKQSKSVTFAETA